MFDIIPGDPLAIVASPGLNAIWNAWTVGNLQFLPSLESHRDFCPNSTGLGFPWRAPHGLNCSTVPSFRVRGLPADRSTFADPGIRANEYFASLVPDA